MNSPPGLLPRDGPRVRLRRLHEADLARFQAYRADPEVGRWQGWNPLPEAEALDFLREMAQLAWPAPGDWFQLAVVDRQDDGLIGDIGLYLLPAGDGLELGFTFARHAQGRGLATEAVTLAVAMVFEHTAVDRLLASADADNGASLRLLERLGFQRTSTQEAVFRGQACQEHHYMLQRHRP